MTYRERQVLVYAADTLELLETFPMPSEIKEGWGMTTDGKSIYISDGTNKVFVVDPESFTVVRTIEVYQGDKNILLINELEWIDGEIWANIFLMDWIVVFDPSTGEVTAWVSLQGLSFESDETLSNRNAVWNGVAYDGTDILLTGKMWSYVYRVKVESTLVASQPPYS
mmetsp:Transcript_11440/g.22437  ORF Transcript_11440/g.22437 Transcript_11440/m.22437 type:complete len:168 (+) Transcript_11440:2126-2629(+)